MSIPTFITLGPRGTCHENALRHYLEFQGLTRFEIALVPDLLEAIVRGSSTAPGSGSAAP